MKSSTPPHAETMGCRIPYAQASPPQIAQALVYANHELREHFPTLSSLTWSNTLQELQPDLWVGEETVTIDGDNLRVLVQRLNDSPELPELEPLIHGPRAGYMAKTLVNYEDDAIHALADMEANPLAYGPLVYRLVVSLALGNAVADEVFRDTASGPWGRPGGADRDVARATVHERLKALRRARGEGEFGTH
ncbi:hypothetical protein ACVWYF_004021 [Hymenobacter sp. UYAg731]